LNLRVFENPKNGDKPWDSSAKDLDLEIMCVSQVSGSTSYNKSSVGEVNKGEGMLINSLQPTDFVFQATELVIVAIHKIILLRSYGSSSKVFLVSTTKGVPIPHNKWSVGH